METIDKNKCIKVGFIQKPYALDGEMILQFKEGFDESIENASVFFLEIDSLLVPFFPDQEMLAFRTQTSAIITLDDVDSPEKAKKLMGCNVYISCDEITAEDEQQDPDYLTGFMISDVNAGEIGRITEVNDYSGNIVISVDMKGKEILIPFSENLIVSIDEENHSIVIQCDNDILSLND
ncbi:MAG: hypothetical protein Q8862_13040 [Bacteroidota bacterium]|nr:hypothetical protein [Bacteroidota bacterium]